MKQKISCANTPQQKTFLKPFFIETTSIETFVLRLYACFTKLIQGLTNLRTKYIPRFKV